MSGGSRKRAFVTGSTGGIGSVLCERLSADGWLVTALARPESNTGPIAALDGLTIVHADLFDERAITEAMRGCDAVFHLAARVHAPDTEPRSSFDRLNIDATRCVVAAAVAASVQSFIFFSTVAVYPERDEMFDESSPVAPSTAYGATKLAAEAIVLERQNEICVTILRLPVVYGPRDRGNVRRLIDAIANRRFVIPGTGANIKTMVGVFNVAHAAVRAAMSEKSPGKIYIVTDDEAPSLNHIVCIISRELKLHRSPPHIPVSILRAAGFVADAVRRATGINLPLTGDQVLKLTASTRYSGETIRKDLNLQYPTPLEEGLASAIAGYQNDLMTTGTH